MILIFQIGVFISVHVLIVFSELKVSVLQWGERGFGVAWSVKAV